jgi:F-type H+-transporting ATPase subunit a
MAANVQDVLDVTVVEKAQEGIDVTIQNLDVFNVFGMEVWFTESLRNIFIVMGVMIVFALFVNLKYRKFKQIPTGFQNFIEFCVETFDGFVKSAAGEKLAPLGKWFFMVFMFVLFSNLSGLFTLRPPTADWNVTVTIALASIVLLHAMGIKHKGGLKYWKGALFEPVIFFFPINLVGEFARPVSLSFRLFGNILSGMILVTLLYNLAPTFVLYGVPLIVHGYFDVFAGVIQTYIICIVSLATIGGAAGTNS